MAAFHRQQGIVLAGEGRSDENFSFFAGGVGIFVGDEFQRAVVTLSPGDIVAARDPHSGRCACFVVVLIASCDSGFEDTAVGRSEVDASLALRAGFNAFKRCHRNLFHAGFPMHGSIALLHLDTVPAPLDDFYIQ